YKSPFVEAPKNPLVQGPVQLSIGTTQNTEPSGKANCLKPNVAVRALSMLLSREKKRKLPDERGSPRFWSLPMSCSARASSRTGQMDPSPQRIKAPRIGIATAATRTARRELTIRETFAMVCNQRTIIRARHLHHCIPQTR